MLHSQTLHERTHATRTKNKKATSKYQKQKTKNKKQKTKKQIAIFIEIHKKAHLFSKYTKKHNIFDLLIIGIIKPSNTNTTNRKPPKTTNEQMLHTRRQLHTPSRSGQICATHNLISCKQ